MVPSGKPLYQALFWLRHRFVDTVFLLLLAIQVWCRLAKYLLFAFPSNTHTFWLLSPTSQHPHTGAFSNHYCRAVCRISMTLSAGHPHPSGFYTSPRGRCDRGLSTYEATCWILVQAKRTWSHLSNLETSLYSKKRARPKQTSRSNNTDSSLCPHGDDLRHYC